MEKATHGPHINFRERLAPFLRVPTYIYIAEDGFVVNSRTAEVLLSSKAKFKLEEQVRRRLGQEVVRHILTYRSDDEAKRRQVVLEDGQLTQVVGIDPNAPEDQKRLFVKNMFHGFARSFAKVA